MKKTPVFTILLTGLLVLSCGKKAPEITGSIPENTFLVASFHPKQLYDKGQLGTMNSFISKIDNEFLKEVIKDPLKSGVAIDEYGFTFIYFIENDPIVGVTAVLSDKGKFNSMIKTLLEEEKDQVREVDGFSILVPEYDAVGMAWNNEQVIMLNSPKRDISVDEMEAMLLSHFNLPKENAITSMVDFNNFTGKMKDANVWFASDELQRIIDNTKEFEGMDFDFPVDLKNNYGQFFVEFIDGAMTIHAETHFSDEVTKAAETFMVAKEELNKDMLKLAPGNDLLMAMAFSIELDKLVNLMKNFTPPEMDSISDQVEQATGVPGNEILDALNGDFVIAVNGAGEGAAIPVELMIGIGIDDETIQKKMMDRVGSMAPVEKDGDFFMINANGIELYSGIVNGIWVITNTKGYKASVTGSGLEKTLYDSKFSEYANGSMGMYMNLDLTTYPAALQSMMSSGNKTKMVELITESFLYMGVEASNYNSDILLKTAKEKENSLYTLLQIAEEAESIK